MIARTLVRGSVAAPVEADDDATLLDVARGVLGLKAAARGCDHGQCGSCRMLLDGAVVAACTVRWRDVREGASLEAAEDLMAHPEGARAVEAFEHARPTRCRLCVAGLRVTAVDLARRGLAREPSAVAATTSATACMCTGRASWRRALLA